MSDLLNIDITYFEQMVGQIYPSELRLNKANSSDAEAQFSDLNLTNGIVSSKIYDKQDDYPHTLLKSIGILQSPPSVTLSPPKPLDEIQPNSVFELVIWRGVQRHFFWARSLGQKVKYH